MIKHKRIVATDKYRRPGAEYRAVVAARHSGSSEVYFEGSPCFEGLDHVSNGLVPATTLIDKTIPLVIGFQGEDGPVGRRMHTDILAVDDTGVYGVRECIIPHSGHKNALYQFSGMIEDPYGSRIVERSLLGAEIAVAKNAQGNFVCIISQASIAHFTPDDMRCRSGERKGEHAQDEPQAGSAHEWGPYSRITLHNLCVNFLVVWISAFLFWKSPPDVPKTP